MIHEPEVCGTCGHGTYAHEVRREPNGCACCPGAICQKPAQERIRMDGGEDYQHEPLYGWE